MPDRPLTEEEMDNLDDLEDDAQSQREESDSSSTSAASGSGTNTPSPASRLYRPQSFGSTTGLKRPATFAPGSSESPKQAVYTPPVKIASKKPSTLLGRFVADTRQAGHLTKEAGRIGKRLIQTTGAQIGILNDKIKQANEAHKKGQITGAQHKLEVAKLKTEIATLQYKQKKMKIDLKVRGSKVGGGGTMAMVRQHFKDIEERRLKELEAENRARRGASEL